MAWTSIPASVYAVGKPITSVSYGYLKDNIEAHDHISGRGAIILQEAIDNAAIGQGELKTAQGSVSKANSGLADLILPGGEYGFYPRIKMNNTSSGIDWNAQICGKAGMNHAGWLSYVTNISLNPGGAATIYAQQRYLQSSPPYKIGNKEWGHFLYMLVNAQGDIVASYEAEDPPYAYNGPPQHAKDSIERIQAIPHPFADYHDKDPAIDGLEIILVDLREHDTKKWKDDNAKLGKGILEDLGPINRKGKIVTPQELGIGDIQGFTDKVKIRKHN